MKITLDNTELIRVMEFINKLELPANKTRAFTKFKKLLVVALEDLQESQNELFNLYCIKNDKGELVPDDQGGYKFIEGQEIAYSEDLKLLLQEKISIDLGMHAELIQKVVPVALEEYTKEINGRDAETYDMILDLFEEMGNE